MYTESYPQDFRNLVVGVDNLVPLANGRMVKAINFDNAATTPPLIPVLNEIISFSPWYSSINRGKGYKSQVSSEVYEESRNIILDFVKGNRETDTVIYVKNTTEGINKLSFRLCNNNKKCVILSTSMEHHSNDLPWRNKYIVDYIDVDLDGRLSIKSMEDKLKKYNGCVKLVTVSGASNVTGFINPIYKIAALAHKYKAKILVDGAQLVPHVSMDMKDIHSEEHIDYLVFSGHKMYAPFGIGVLIGPKDTFKVGAPDYTGGGTVKIVTHDFVSWNDPPNKEEAGSPNLMGVVALIASIKTLSSIGMRNIEANERKLTDYTLSKLSEIPGVNLYGNKFNSTDRVGIISFNINGLHHNAVAEILSYEAGIAVRTGCFCAQPYVQSLLKISDDQIKEHINHPDAPRPGMVRISFGLYNTYKEVDVLINMLWNIAKNIVYYKNKYDKS